MIRLLVSKKMLVFLVFVGAVILTTVVYWPGLSGGYIFDDFPNIVDNPAIHITRVTLGTLSNAAFSSTASDFQRPLASISFALNWVKSGDDPYAMKATNLVIHLLNGSLLYLMLSVMLKVRAIVSPDERTNSGAVWKLITAVSVAWMLLPLNLTAVLYIVQRMESLCQLFVLSGLATYFIGRRISLRARNAMTDNAGIAIATAGILAGTALGLLAKESAAMLPLYAFIAEALLLGFKNMEGRRDRRLLSIFVAVLMVPMISGFTWLLPYVLNLNSWAGRNFTIGQRLLTEPRVLVEYLQWTLLPNLGSLSLYHDDFLPSNGLLSPWTTIGSIVFLSFLLGAAVWQHSRRPLFALGVLWFFAAHLLTSTIVPLELIFEHRNYFASIGILFATFSLLFEAVKSPRLRDTLPILLIGMFACVTYLRAQDWSNPLRLALREADGHPESFRANYGAAIDLLSLSDFQPSPSLDSALLYLNRANRLPNASLLADEALIVVADRSGVGNEVVAWHSLIGKLRVNPVNSDSIEALSTLTKCRAIGKCKFDPELLSSAFNAALSCPTQDARLFAEYAAFSRDLLHDIDLAQNMFERAVEKSPRDSGYREDLFEIYLAHGRADDARKQLIVIKRLNTFGKLDASIAILEGQLPRTELPSDN